MKPLRDEGDLGPNMCSGCEAEGSPVASYRVKPRVYSGGSVQMGEEKQKIYLEGVVRMVQMGQSEERRESCNWIAG